MSAEQRVLGRVVPATHSGGATRAAWAWPKLRPGSLLPWIVPVVIAAGWEIGASLAWIPARLLPPPSVVLQMIWSLAASVPEMLRRNPTAKPATSPAASAITMVRCSKGSSS